jgi:hypothetical protein
MHAAASLGGASAIKEGMLLFEPVADQTRCTYTALVQAGGVFALAEPFLASPLKKAMQTSLAAAKHVLETRR